MRLAALTIMVCLLLGAVINVAVAWGFVFWTPMMPTTSSPIGAWPVEVPADWPPAESIVTNRDHGLILRTYIGTNSIARFGTLRRPLNEAKERAWAIDDPARRSSTARSAIDEFSQSSFEAPNISAQIRVLKSGWPMLSTYHEQRCLETTTRSTGQSSVDLAGTRQGLAIPAWIPWCEHEYRDTRRIPMSIIPLGFAANTVLYASCVWALLILLPRALRTHLRQRRGCCTACGYDLRGAAHERCPECGAPAIASLRSSARSATQRTTSL